VQPSSDTWEFCDSAVIHRRRQGRRRQATFVHGWLAAESARPSSTHASAGLRPRPATLVSFGMFHPVRRRRPIAGVLSHLAPWPNWKQRRPGGGVSSRSGGLRRLRSSARRRGRPRVRQPSPRLPAWVKCAVCAPLLFTQDAVGASVTLATR
jgi:hypothetical protein